jgi:Domain of unknown function (DUF4381)
MSTHLEGLNLIELLDLLEPVPEPPAIALTPQTPGWIVLGLVVLALLVWAILRTKAHRRANAYRRAALVELATTQGNVTHIAEVLRRTAMAGYGRMNVAALTGEDWLAFLDKSFGGTGFSDGPGKVLITAPYRANTIANDAALIALAENWVRKHQQDLI